VLCATLLSLSGAISPGLAAIAITQSNSFTMAMYWLSRQWSMLEQDLNSVERVDEYLPPKIPAEPPAVIEENRPPAAWPSNKGGIRFENVVLRYDPSLDPVLRGVSFEIFPGEKIGIVGRTGAGKSSMATALLRFAELSEGKIIIDDIDISTIGLDDLRSRLTLIPQDPILFNGTVRENLDPFNESTDEQCLDVLHRVKLISSRPNSRMPSRPASIRNGATYDVSEAPSESGRPSLTLESKVSEGGGNLSQGQRQLLAMARAMLRDSNIIIADEATASIDFQTDQQIQQAIRESFSDMIMLVIAHRLTTIASFDRVIVLDQGKIVEFDTPKRLLENEQGHFFRMCKHSGDFETLLRMASRD
jgi:ABC-type multidrug transport system fused ATPase/permease subunit